MQWCPQPETSPGGSAGEDEDEYTSESTEEVPALRGEPLTKGVRKWTLSQFPLVLTLCKDLKSGEFLPEEVQVARLDDKGGVFHALHGSIQSVWGLCPQAVYGKAVPWKGSRMGIAVQFGGDMAHYLLATLFSLELRGAILCDIGPTNAMVRTNDPYSRAVFGDVAGWSFHRKLRHRGVGGFLNIFQAYPSVQAELERILVVAKQTGLQPAFKLAANNCGRFGVFLANEGLAVLEINTHLEPADLPFFPQELTWAEQPE